MFNAFFRAFRDFRGKKSLILTLIRVRGSKSGP